MSKFYSSNLFLGIVLLLSPLFALSAPATVAAEGLESSIKQRFNSFIERDENAILPPDEAFQLTVKVLDAQTLNAHFSIAPGHYLYRDRIKFEVGDAPNKSITSELPKGDIKQDPTFGSTEVFHTGFDSKLRLNVAGPGTLTVLASYQGCSEKGLCYAPIHKSFQLTLPGTAQTSSTASANPSSASASQQNQSASTLNSEPGSSPGSVGDDQISSVLKSGKLWLIVSLFFVAGILVSFTPCMLPMIPVLSGIIVGASSRAQAGSGNAALSRRHSFNLSLAYTLGMALCYTLAGIAAGLSGHLLSSSLQSPWILACSAIVFVLLSLAMFGCYELRLPSSLQDRMVNASNRLKGGHFLGVFAMGAFSALILSPCVAPALFGALVYISQTRDVVLGGTALFALSMGMGVPLLLIGASAGAILPKAGPWMNAVRNFFGVVMLAVAIWVISPVLPVSLVLGLWAALLIVCSVYMHALDSLAAHASSAAKLAKGMAVLLLVAGIAMLIGALSGAKSPLQPLAAIASNRNMAGGPDQIENSQINARLQTATHLRFEKIADLKGLQEKIESAEGKIIMLDFYADWCVACKELEQFTFSDARVQRALQNVVLLQADVTLDNPQDRALLKQFKLFGPPGIVFFDRTGQEQLKIVGYQDAAKFLATLARLQNRS